MYYIIRTAFCSPAAETLSCSVYLYMEYKHIPHIRFRTYIYECIYIYIYIICTGRDRFKGLGWRRGQLSRSFFLNISLVFNVCVYILHKYLYSYYYIILRNYRNNCWLHRFWTGGVIAAVVNYGYDGIDYIIRYNVSKVVLSTK